MSKFVLFYNVEGLSKVNAEKNIDKLQKDFKEFLGKHHQFCILPVREGITRLENIGAW